jgi:hypothetical protein
MCGAGMCRSGARGGITVATSGRGSHGGIAEGGSKGWLSTEVFLSSQDAMQRRVRSSFRSRSPQQGVRPMVRLFGE